MQTIDILSAEELRRTINRLASQIVETHSDLANVVMLGIRTRGVPLAQLITRQIEHLEQFSLPTGAIDITLYRDDLDQIGLRAPDHNQIPADLTGKQVILIDDVIFSGRTVRAALSAILDYGRPKTIKLAVLVDRGHRELPIHADFVGKTLPTARDELVKVFLQATDGQDGVQLIKP